ncbi:MAG TPA: hypothetical protein VFA89_03895 [Terriglobales bacterium]|nr:hypothetical protein [Terriglobales bacterium]
MMAAQPFKIKVSLVLIAVALLLVIAGLRVWKRETNAASTLPTKETMMNEPSGFYCDAKALNRSERDHYDQLTSKLAEGRVETKELPDGYAFRLQNERVSLSDLAEWISFERRCCPFFEFEIEVQRNNGPLWLKLRGADGIKPFIRSEFNVT